MKTYRTRLIVICMLAAVIAGFTPQEAGAQRGPGESPILLIKIRDIDLFSRNFEKLIPSTAGSNTPQQLTTLRGMLQGTDWIDPDRSIVAGTFLKDAKADLIVFVPFRKANPSFQKSLGATSGQDYYLTVFPPRPGYKINPAMEKSLLDASLTGTDGGLVIEAAAGRLLEVIEPQIAASLAKMDASLPANPEPAAMSPQDARIFLDDMLNTLKQVDILRFGVDFSGDVLSLQFDIDSRPGTLLAGVLTDRGGVARLPDYPIDMPLRFRSRPHDMAGMTELMESAFGRLYRLLGIDFDEMSELTKSFTGETAGGMNLDSSGFAFEMIAVLQPGVKGEDFIQNVYLPWFEHYNRQMSEMVAKQTGQAQKPLYERTSDSIVSGIKVLGVRTNFNSLIPADKKTAGIPESQVFEMRMASAGDLMLIASDDVKMQALITRASSLATTAASGPTVRFDMNLNALLKGMQSLATPAGSSPGWPSDLGIMTMQAEMKNGKLTTRTSFETAKIGRLVSVLQALAARK